MPDHPLHGDELPFGASAARQLVDQQFPDWAHRPLQAIGAGTDNRMYRLGDDLVLRLPRTAAAERNLVKERRWLPRLAPHLPVAVPEPVAHGEPDGQYPFTWSVYRWIQGHEPDLTRLARPEQFGVALAGFVEALESIDLMGAERAGDLSWYRGGPLSEMADTTAQRFAVLDQMGTDLDVASLRSLWLEALALGGGDKRHVWMHADLRPANLLARDDRLAGVVDFGGLSVGEPTCEHAALWALPATTRLAYGDRLSLGPTTRARARGWALTLALGVLTYYADTWPEFARDAQRQLERLLVEPL